MSETATEKKPRKPRTTRKPKDADAAAPVAPSMPPDPAPISLLDALKFAAIAQQDTGPAYARHVVLWHGWLYAFDGVVGIGTKIAEHLGVAAHTATLMAALQRAKSGPLVLTVQDTQLIVSAGRLRVPVPCVDLQSMPWVEPDPPTVPLTPAFRDALALVAPIASATATRVALACVLLRSGSCVGTDGNIIVEAWHGANTPRLCLPKETAAALLKCPKAIVSVGSSPGRCTFYFDDGSWLRSQLYEDKYPDIDPILNRPNNPQPVPEGFFEAVAAVSPFVGESGALSLSPFGVSVKLAPSDASRGASFDFEGIGGNYTFAARCLNMIAPYAKSIDFGKNGEGSPYAPLAFYGDNVRGMIAPMVDKA
jgi:hypothetical protein